MTRFLTVALAMVAIAATSLMPPAAYADDFNVPGVNAPLAAPAAATVKVQGDLQLLTIVSGPAKLNELAATPLDKLPKEAAYVARNFKDATYASDGKTLVIGLRDGKGVKSGETIATFKLRSDCANNSQFTPQETVAEAVPREHLKAALVAWTQHRHDAKTAPILNFNVHRNGYPDGPDADAKITNYDVQLNLKTATVSQR